MFVLSMNLQQLKAIGGPGVFPKIFDLLCLDIFLTPGYGGPGTFYGIEKFCPASEISAVKVGTFSVILARNGPKWGKIDIF
jgi:hypothetical protein